MTGTRTSRTGLTTTIRRSVVPCLLGLLLLAPAPAAAEPAPERQRRDSLHINELVRDGRQAEALLLCREFVATWPDDGVMAYNLACLENTVGDQERAVAAFAAALAAGFSECAHAADDPDLQGAIQARLTELCAADQQRRDAVARSQALELVRDQWSASRGLIRHPGPVAAYAGPQSRPEVRLRWLAAGLEVELAAGPDWEALLGKASLAPWQGGPGLLVTIGIPAGDALQTNNYFEFAFGREAKGSVGGLYVAAQGLWQRVAELTPVLIADPETGLRLTATIPWTALEPYDPVVDPQMGVNFTLVTRDEAGLHVAALVPDSDAMDSADERRIAPLVFATDSVADDTFLGRLDSSLGRGEPLAIDLVAVSSVAGDATLNLNFKDQAGRSVLPTGPIQGVVPLERGTNRLARQADFSALKTGGYLIEAELIFPSGDRGDWSAPVLQLAPDWQAHYRERITYVALAEQATAGYLFDTIVEATENHQERRNPGAIITSLIDLDRMLVDAEESGTILPDKGSFVFVYPGPRGEDRLCRLYLPAGRLIADAVNPVIVIGQGRNQEARLAARIGQNYEHGSRKPTLKTGDDNRFPVYLVPEIEADGRDLITETDACRRWAMVFFQTPYVSLVAVDALGWTGLQLAGRVEKNIHGVLVFAGAHLEPWPQAPPGFIRQKVAPAPGDLPITWLDFTHETGRGGQGRELLQALKDVGYNIVEEQNVRGGLNLTQVGDRIVHWAEGLR